jgi:hypothetical protein
MHIEPAGDGEYWEFRWYIDPISNGLGNWIRLIAHVSEDGVRMIGMPVARSEEESVAQQEAVAYIKDRYERLGLDEENTEGGN